jgi:hypothetical protein
MSRPAKTKPLGRVGWVGSTRSASECGMVTERPHTQRPTRVSGSPARMSRAPPTMAGSEW